MNAKQLKETKEALKKVTIYHHSSLTKGYQKVNQYILSEYAGKFGKGYKLEYPTKESICSNEYHRVEYYIKTKK